MLAIAIQNGAQFEHLTVLRQSDARTKSGEIQFECQCSCGKLHTTASRRLRDGLVLSCGHLRGQHSITHGESCGDKESVEYGAYLGARSRCNNPNDSGYMRYGGRGIEFRFNSFEEFLAEVGRRPTAGHSLDRYPNNNGHYEKDNVRWATRQEQARNRRSNRLVAIEGEIKSFTEWTEIYNIDSRKAFHRLQRLQWCIDCALSNNAKTCLHRA